MLLLTKYNKTLRCSLDNVILGVTFDRNSPSRFQLRVIRAFKSTLEDLEERRSCHSLQSLHTMRNSRSHQGNRPMSDIGYIDEDPSNKSPNLGVDGRKCGVCDDSGPTRTVTPADESSPTTAETAPLVPSDNRRSAGGGDARANSQPSTKCCHHYINTHHPTTLLPNLSSHHFNNLVSQTLHSNMAAHSSSLQPASSPSTPMADVPNLVHETSI